MTGNIIFVYPDGSKLFGGPMPTPITYKTTVS